MTHDTDSNSASFKGLEQLQIRSEGVSRRLPTQHTTVTRSSGGVTRSFSSSPTPGTTFELDEAQLAAADAAAGSGAGWDAACRQANAGDAVWSGFDHRLCRQALQSRIEDRRGNTRA